jgi:hypothetical protein
LVAETVKAIAKVVATVKKDIDEIKKTGRLPEYTEKTRRIYRKSGEKIRLGILGSKAGTDPRTGSRNHKTGRQ